MEGLSIDKIYENFVRQINGDKLQAENEEEGIGGVVMDHKYTHASSDSPIEQMMENLKSIEIPKLEPIYPIFDYKTITQQISDSDRDSIIPEGYFEKTQEYQQKSLEVLQSINENTANLYTIVELINQSNDKQDELISLMTEVLSLAKVKSKEEADTLFKKIMSKINETADSVDSIIKIVGWATTVYNMVIPLLS